MRQLLPRTLFALGLLLGQSGAVSATTIYTIDVPNAALVPFGGPYASVSISLIDPTHASVTFTALTNSGFLYLMGGQAAADLNVSSTYTLGTVTAAGPGTAGFSAPSFVANAPGNVSSFGVMNLSLNFFDGFTNAATSISFILTDTGGTWANDASVLAANASGYFAAVHSFACAIPCSSTAGAAVTGFAGNNKGGLTVPEPQTLAMLGLGLLGLVITRRRHS